MVILWTTEFIGNGKFYAIQTQLAKIYVMGHEIQRKTNDTDVTTESSCTLYNRMD